MVLSWPQWQVWVQMVTSCQCGAVFGLYWLVSSWTILFLVLRVKEMHMYVTAYVYTTL